MLNEHDLADLKPSLPTAPEMRAKLVVLEVHEGKGYAPIGQEPEKVSERLVLSAVGNGKPYAADGTGDEDNTFSRWTPCARLDITVQNPALFGQFKPGDRFYVDFTRAAD